jgi:hypothetical protein
MNQETEINKMLAEKRSFEALKSGSVFKIPTYKVIAGKGLEKQERTILLPIVRGNRYDVQTGTEYFAVEGTTQETLIAVLLQDLESKNEILPSENTSLAIKHLQAALDLLEERQRDRFNRNVLATQQP